MSFSPSQNTCREWLIQLAQQDSFIGRRDQTPLIDECQLILEEGLLRLEKDINSHLLRLMDEVKSDLIKQTQTIKEAHRNLEEAFELLRQSPHSAITNKRLSYALDQQENLLSRRLRPRLLRVLEKLSPKYQTIEKPLLELNGFRLHTVKPVAQYLWLLRSRDRRKTIEPGGRILELEIEPRLDALCRWPFISGLKFSLMRLRCMRRYAFYRLPMKDIVVDCLIAGSDIKPQRLIQRHAATHEELQSRLADAWRGIRYNLETAATELDDIREGLRSGRREDIGDRPEELRTIVLDAFTKCLETIDDVRVTYASFMEAVVAEISQDHQNALASIKSAVAGSLAWKFRARWMWRLWKKDRQKHIERFTDYVRNIFFAEKKQPKKTRASTSWRVLLLGFFFQRRQPVEQSLLQLTDLPTETELLEKSKVLPPIYRRLFRNEPLTNREFLVGMEQEMNLLSETFQRWQSGRASSVAIIGPEGSGKTSLINCFENDLNEEVNVVRAEIGHRMLNRGDILKMLEEVLRIEEPSATAAELISKIMRLERQVIILEHGHQLFLRAVGARESLETFFYIMMNTRTHLFWLLSFRLLPWTRLGYLNNIERFFTHIIKSEFHNVQELKTAVLLRQRATGQEPVFSHEGADSYRLRKLLSQYRLVDAPVQQALADIYFGFLYELTGGNMETALYYWLRSLTLDEQGRVNVQPCVKVDTGFIQKLDITYLLSLAEVLAHGGLTPGEHGEIFNLELLRSRLILDYLRQIRLLKGHSKDKHGQPLFYTVNTLFYQPVHGVLSDMHLIY